MNIEVNNKIHFLNEDHPFKKGDSIKKSNTLTSLNKKEMQEQKEKQQIEKKLKQIFYFLEIKKENSDLIIKNILSKTNMVNLLNAELKDQVFKTHQLENVIHHLLPYILPYIKNLNRDKNFNIKKLQKNLKISEIKNLKGPEIIEGLVNDTHRSCIQSVEDGIICVIFKVYADGYSRSEVSVLRRKGGR